MDLMLLSLSIKVFEFDFSLSLSLSVTHAHNHTQITHTQNMHCTHDKNQRSGGNKRFMCQVNTHKVNKTYL